MSTEFRFSRPSAIMARTMGNCLASRAARIRRYAASSESRSSPTQYANMDGYPAGAYSLRASTSARCASMSAVVQRSCFTMVLSSWIKT